MRYEIVRENNIKEDNHMAFLKWNYVNTEKLNNFKNGIKDEKTYYVEKTTIERISGLLKKDELGGKINSLIPFSFILYGELKLSSPYFSRDDDDFYLIQNPCLKEKAFKVPMIRGSGWKGVIAKAAKDLINEDFSWFSSYVRVFGTGSKEYRGLIDDLVRDKNITDNLIKYLLFELGKKLTKEDIKSIKENPKNYLKGLNDNFTKESIGKTPFLNIHKGRAIFYPTYFAKLSLEIINPHSRKTRAGTNPIHYELVPKDAEGILQIDYIPHDGILTAEGILKQEVEKDIKFLTECIEKTAENGVGAKTKLGWGKFDFTEKSINCNVAHLEIPEGWKK